MEQYLQAAFLGLTQGLTEFIPVSSSGHLVLVRQVLDWPDQGLAFDAVLHLATLLAVLIYFRADWRNLWLAMTTKKQTYELRYSRKLAGLIIVTTVPAVGAGLLMANFLETTVRHIPSVAGLMIFTGLMMFVVERIARSRKDIGKLHFWDALSVGLAQAVAILPGISRSGATIMAGMYHGLNREAAARYSFLAAAPIILGAGLYSLWRLWQNGNGTMSWLSLLLGFGVALTSGLLAIHWLLQFLRHHRLIGFGWYLALVGIGLLGFNWLR